MEGQGNRNLHTVPQTRRESVGSSVQRTSGTGLRTLPISLCPREALFHSNDRQLRPHGRGQEEIFHFLSNFALPPVQTWPSIFERSSTWSLAGGRAKANIYESVMSLEQCRQVMRRAILRQVVQDQVRNRRMLPIIPNTSTQLAEKETGLPLSALLGPKPPRKRGMVAKYPAASGKTTTNNLLEQRRTPFSCNTLRTQLGAAHLSSNNHALQISDMRNPVQDDLVFSGNVTQLRIDELTVSEWRPQHFHAFVGSATSPHHSPACCGQPVATERFESVSVPNLRLAQMDFDAGTSPQLTPDHVEDGESSVRAADGAQIVEEGHPGSTASILEAPRSASTLRH